MFGRKSLRSFTRLTGARSFLSFKPDDDIERENWKARKAALPAIVLGFLFLTLEALVGGNVWVVPATIAAIFLCFFVASKAGRLRVTETHLEIRGLLRTKRILRSDIRVVVFDTYIQESRYFSQEERIAIFVGKSNRALGHIAQRRWSRKVLSDVHLALHVKDLHYDHETGPAELSDIFPGLFPYLVRHPHRFAIMLVAPITILIIVLNLIFG